MRVKRSVHTVLGEDDLTVLLLDFRTLYHIRQMAFGIGRTNTTAHCSVLAEGIAYTVTHHTVFALRSFHRTQIVCEHLEGLFSVEIIGIDDCKRLFDQILTHEHCVVRTPWFSAFGVVSATFRHFVNRLKAHFTGHLVSILGQYFLTKISLEILTDHEHDFTKPCTQCVKHTVVHDGLTIGSQTI